MSIESLRNIANFGLLQHLTTAASNDTKLHSQEANLAINVLSLSLSLSHTHTHTHTHPFNGPFSGTTQVSRYQKGKTNLDFTEARVSEWQWLQLGHVQVCTSLQQQQRPFNGL